MENILICRHCSKICKNENSLRNHERLCKENPNRSIVPKKTEAFYEAMKIRKNSNQFIKAKELGEQIPENGMKGKPGYFKHHTEETKKKISESMKKKMVGNTIWVTALEKRKSFAEQFFDDLFPELKQNYHVDRYFLDLANPEKKVYLEVDGEQHYTDNKVIQHDKERTERLESLGWTCLMRIRWSKFKKLSKEEQGEIIKDLRTKL